MNKTKLLFVLVASLALAACAGPQPSKLIGANELPADWLMLPPGDWRVKTLDAPTQQLLSTTKKLMAAERNTSAYRFYNKYSASTIAAMESANRAADQSYLAASKTLQRNLTPELYSTATTKDEANWDWYQVTNQNLRMVGDDWARFWLVDRPSYLSPYPIVNTTGNP
jgi:hypothetical protein